MPGEASLGRLGAPGTRVFKLAFEGSADRTVFLWPQEPEASGDDRLVAAFNKAVNEVEVEDEDMDADESGSEEEEGGEMDVSGGPIQAAHLAAALLACGLPPPPPGSAPARPPAAAARPQAAPQTAGSGRIDAASLAAALAGAGGAGAATTNNNQAAAAAALRALARAPGPSLAEVLRPDALRPLLTSEAALAALAPHLPEGHRSLAGLHDVLASAQWRAQLDTLSGALTTGQLDLAQFGLRAGGFTVADFLQAVQDAVDAEKKQKEEEGDGGGGGAA
jgi:26S proteasome regulatory subunit N13